VTLPTTIRDALVARIEDGLAAARRTGSPARFVLMSVLRDAEEMLIDRASRQRSNARALATLRVAREWGIASDTCRAFPMSTRGIRQAPADGPRSLLAGNQVIAG